MKDPDGVLETELDVVSVADTVAVDEAVNDSVALALVHPDDEGEDV